MTVDLGAPATPAGRPTDHATTRPAVSPRHAALREAAVAVLDRNWTGTATIPSSGLYPHQWSWDSAFIAVGLRHHAPERARCELRTLLAAQWGDGRVPHIVFNSAVPLASYFPSPDFWRSSTAGAAAGAPASVETSGIVQPPVHALAAWLVHQADPVASAREGFLERLYPRLTAWHRYLTRQRDLGGGGLPACVHPWEPGMDNSPCWDAPLQRVSPVEPGTFRRADLDHGEAGDRPTDLDYGRYVRLAADYREAGYRDDPADGASHAFAVEDPGTVALLIVSERALGEIAAAVGADPAPHRAEAARLTDALVARLWDEEAGMFLVRDVADPGGETLLPCRSAAGLLPLVVPGLPERIVTALVRTLTGPHFGLGATTTLAPSFDLLDPDFDTCRYWRGPAWFNVNWLLERGLRRYGHTALADVLRANVLGSAVASGFAEYVDPRTGEAHGTRHFGWTAALALDLLRQEERAPRLEDAVTSTGSFPRPRTAPEGKTALP